MFETMRAKDGRVPLLSRHLGRLREAAAALRIPCPELAWEKAVAELLGRQGLGSGLARVKIVLTRGVLAEVPSPTLLITAFAYAPPPPAEFAQGWKAVLYPVPRLLSHARWKTTSYLSSLQADEYARERGAEEALFAGPDGVIQEGSRTSVFLLERGAAPVLVVPPPEFRLRSVAEGWIREWWRGQGGRVEVRPFTAEALFRAEGAFLCNALMGVMPVAGLDGRELSRAPEMAERIRQALG